MDTRALHKTLAELKATQARLDALADETQHLNRRLASQRRTQWLLVFFTVVLLMAVAAACVWLVRSA